jgi:hypothetical protein
MTDRAGTLISGRRGRIASALGRPLPTPLGSEGDPVTDEDREHLVNSAADLYWNELEWEHLTDEERTDDGQLTELAFGGFLAFVRGLLLHQVMPDSLAPAEPRPEVVEDLLMFLAEQVIELQGRLESEDDEDPARTKEELKMTDTLVDLVLLSFHNVDPGDVEGFREVTAH